MIPPFRTRALIAAVAVALTLVPLVPLVGQAQDRTAYLLPVPEAAEALGLHFGRATPGMTASSPLAFGPQLGDLYVGGNYQLPTRYSDSDDVSLTAGFGLGNSIDAVGLEVAMTATSTFSAGVADRLSVAVKASRITVYGIAVAAGMEGFAVTGGASSEARRSLYGVVSKVFDLTFSSIPAGYLSSVTVNLGAGDGRFCREAVAGGVPAGEDDCNANMFASVGVRATEWLGIVADWTGQDLALAASIAPLKKLPIVIAPGLADITGSGGDGVRFTLGFGMSIKY